MTKTEMLEVLERSHRLAMAAIDDSDIGRRFWSFLRTRHQIGGVADPHRLTDMVLADFAGDPKFENFWIKRLATEVMYEEFVERITDCRLKFDSFGQDGHPLWRSR